MSMLRDHPCPTKIPSNRIFLSPKKTLVCFGLTVLAILSGKGCSSSTSDDPKEQPTPSVKTLVIPMVIQDAEHETYLFSFSKNGEIEELDLKVTAGHFPRALDIRKDNKELLLTYASSGPGTDKGVLVFETNPATREIAQKQDLILGDRQSPTDIAYLDTNHAVVSCRGPDQDGLVFLERSPNGEWEKAQELATGDGPLQIHRLNADEFLILRNSFSSSYSELFVVNQTENTEWKTHSPGLDIWGTPIHMALHGQTQTAFVATSEPDTAMDPTGPGLLHVFEPSADANLWAGREDALDLPHRASQIVMDSNKTLLVTAGAIVEFNPEFGAWITAGFYMMTFAIDSSGMPEEMAQHVTRLDVSMVDAWALEQGFLIIAFHAYDKDWIEHPFLQVFEQDGPGNWLPLAEPWPLPGRAEQIGVLRTN